MKTFRLGKDIVLYAVGTLLQRSASLVLVPIYTTVLSVSEYGALETLTVIVQTVLIIINFGLSNALIRYYSECEDDSDIMVMFRTSWLLVASLSFILFLFFLPAFRILSFSLFKNEAYTSFLALAFIWAIGGALNQQLFAYYRARQDAQTYVSISLGFFLVLTVLNILFVRILGFKLMGVLLGNLIVVWITNLLGTIKFWSHSREISIVWARRLFGFGFPLVFSMLGWLILDSADRYFLAYYRDMTEVGVYGLGYKVGLLILMSVVTPFQLAWGPFMFAHYRTFKEHARTFYSRVFSYLLLLICFAGLIVFLFSSEIVNFLGSGKFMEATRVVPYVLVAYMFRGIFYWAGGFFHLMKKTMVLSAIVLIMALINLGLNWIWVPDYGWVGAAFSTILTIGGCGLLTLLVGELIYKVPLQWGRLIKLSTGIIFVVSLYFLFSPQNGISGLFFKLSLILFFSAWIFLSQFFGQQEIRNLLLQFKTILQKAGLVL